MHIATQCVTLPVEWPPVGLLHRIFDGTRNCVSDSSLPARLDFRRETSIRQLVDRIACEDIDEELWPNIVPKLFQIETVLQLGSFSGLGSLRKFEILFLSFSV